MARKITTEQWALISEIVDDNNGAIANLITASENMEALIEAKATLLALAADKDDLLALANVSGDLIALLGD